MSSSLLAYTTVSDLFYLPTPLEVAIYLAGLVFLMVCPYIFIPVADKLLSAIKQSRQKPSRPEPQQRAS